MQAEQRLQQGGQMKKLVITFTLLLIASMQARAQGLPETSAQTSTQQSTDSANTIPPLQRQGTNASQESIELPDAPLPKGRS